MKVMFGGTTLVVEREPDDPKFYGVKHAAGESRFMHHLKLKLNSMGFDFVKKLMYSDGHLVDEYQHYLRARHIERLKEGEIYCIYNSTYALRGAEQDFNKGDVTLEIVRYPC